MVKRRKLSDGQNGRSGVGIDFAGNPTIDPTENVKALQEASNKAQREQDVLRDRISDAKLKRIEDLGDCKASRLEAMADLRSKHATQLADMRSRLDDKLTELREKANDKISDLRERYGERSATSALEAIKTLATSTTETATSLATTYAGTVSRLEERIGQLERTTAIALGKEGVAAPQIQELLSEVKKLRSGEDIGEGRGKGFGLSWNVILGIGALIIALSALPSILNAVRPVTVAAPQLQIPPGYMLVPTNGQPTK